MADSNITKKALAAALKELMEYMTFDKITIGHICSNCDMSRKSFYYHFKDKYDLVNWIYYTEFVSTVNSTTYTDGFAFLTDLCVYFEKNRTFYRKVLKYDGQNSFFDYFKEIIKPVVIKYTGNIFAENENTSFYVDFFSDAFLNAIKKWLIESNDLSATKFVSLIQSCIQGTAKKIVNDLNSGNSNS